STLSLHDALPISGSFVDLCRTQRLTEVESGPQSRIGQSAPSAALNDSDPTQHESCSQLTLLAAVVRNFSISQMFLPTVFLACPLPSGLALECFLKQHGCAKVVRS